MKNKIIKIINIFQNKEKEEKAFDNKKFEEFNNIFKPEVFLSNLDSLGLHYFRLGVRDNFNKYKDFRDSSDILFLRQILNNKFIKFNQSFDELDIFLALNFYSKGDGFYFMNAFDKDEIKFSKQINELITLRNVVKERYLDFIRTAQSPYLSFWTQIYIIVLIISIVLNIFFFIKAC